MTPTSPQRPCKHILQLRTPPLRGNTGMGQNCPGSGHIQSHGCSGCLDSLNSVSHILVYFVI